MGKTKLFFLIIFSVFFVSGCSLPGFLQKKNAALKITTNPAAQVFLNNEKVGETPFETKELKGANYSVRLIPNQDGLSEWETTVDLFSGLTTVILYDFAKERQDSSGAILTLEPLASKDSLEVAIISLPDSASIKINGQPKGFTSLQIGDLSAGEHTLLVSAPGYKQREMQIKTISGYKLSIEVQLAKETLAVEESSESALPENKENLKNSDTDESTVKKPSTSKTASPSAEITKPYVEILDTPTGWLRVRSEPTVAEDNEIAKVNPGEKYPFLDSNDTGWYQIKLTDGTEGWISGQYAKLYQ
jgi:hypothetical protein